MTPQEVIEVTGSEAGFFEMAEIVATYKGYRDSAKGDKQEVTIYLYDYGEGKGQRYWVLAESEDGAMATGNAAASPEMALSIVHWSNLDRAEPQS